MKRKIGYYLDLNYKMEIYQIPDEEGGGFQASIPLLGKHAFIGDGDTIEEAIQSLNNVKEYLFKKYIAEGIPIIEPVVEEEKDFSGKFLLRIPSELHRFLVNEAKKNNSTLNQYCSYLLTRKSYLHNIQEEINSLSTEIKDVFTRIREINYKIDHPKSAFAEKCDQAWGFNMYKKSA